jgi:hypothetical protein
MSIVYSNSFSGKPAYRYLRATDNIPTYDEFLAEFEQTQDPDPLCKVKLFHPMSRLTYYVYAATDYSGQIILSGYMVSPLGPDCDEEGDTDIEELANLRPLPVERDLHWTPKRLSAVKAEYS